MGYIPTLIIVGVLIWIWSDIIKTPFTPDEETDESEDFYHK